ncbi:MAG TPA: transcriptional repressor, partial [Ruminococcaceae bacterium]|nr:transcriptional repressor [Oscillospiraceae bacterium]
MSNVKHSKQRDAILKELRSRKDHPTAEDLYLTLKTE